MKQTKKQARKLAQRAAREARGKAPMPVREPAPMPDLCRMCGGKRKQKHSPPLRIDLALPLHDLQTLDRWRNL